MKGKANISLFLDAYPVLCLYTWLHGAKQYSGLGLLPCRVPESPSVLFFYCNSYFVSNAHNSALHYADDCTSYTHTRAVHRRCFGECVRAARTVGACRERVEEIAIRTGRAAYHVLAAHVARCFPRREPC